jgi:hypothetical protein
MLKRKITEKMKKSVRTTADLDEKDQAFDWMDRLRQWKQVQLSSGAVTSFEKTSQNVFKSVSTSVLGCLQADFEADQLQDKVETNLVNGLRRSAGLHFLNFIMGLNMAPQVFLDLLQWFSSSLRNNKS